MCINPLSNIAQNSLEGRCILGGEEWGPFQYRRPGSVLSDALYLLTFRKRLIMLDFKECCSEDHLTGLF